MIAACVLPRLASTCAASTLPAQRDFVVFAAPASSPASTVSPHARVLDASEGALVRGVLPGQRLLDAQQRAPDLRVVVVDGGRLWREVLTLAELLYRHGPACEPLAPVERTCLPYFAVLVDLRGVPRSPARLLSDLARAVVDAGHTPVIALSPSRSLSLALAKDMAARPARWGRALLHAPVGPGQSAERDRLRARIGVDALEIERDVVDALRAAGAATARDLVPLLSSGLVERLGASARRVLPVIVDAADPADIDDVVTPWRPAEIVAAERELEHAVTTLEPLLFLLRPLVEDVLRRLRARAGRLLELTVSLSPRGAPVASLPVAFPAGVVDAAVALRVVQARLERAFAMGLPLGEGVRALALTASRTTTAPLRQLEVPSSSSSSSSSSSGAPGDAVGGLIAELSAELGPGRVGRLQATRSALPEQMTALAPPTGPLPTPEDGVAGVKPRRRHRPVATDPRTTQGRFTVGWPWPLSVLATPVRLDRPDEIVEETLFARLDGEDGGGPWEREYRVVLLVDGRRALCIWDAELGERLLWGWFD